MRYSVIIPVYNRPEEIDELLKSLAATEFKDFETLVVEDGSDQRCEAIVRKYKDQITVSYFLKENTGQGFSRNWAAEKAKGEYLVFFDSDCLVPPDYFNKLEDHFREEKADAWGGPDKAHPDFTLLQQAIGFTMSSVLTTGGIRGKKAHLGKFQPRSFNMGIKKAVFQELDGFSQTNMGEDIELSTRILKNGFTTTLIPEAYVFHKRRDTIVKFFRQVYNFGAGRVINSKKNRGALKLVHLLPLAFMAGFLLIPVFLTMWPRLGMTVSLIYGLYFFLIFITSLFEYKSLLVAVLAVPVVLVQFVGYAMGMIGAWVGSKKS